MATAENSFCCLRYVRKPASPGALILHGKSHSLDRVSLLRSHHARARSGGLPPQGPCDRLPGSPRLVGGLARHGAVVRSARLLRLRAEVVGARSGPRPGRRGDQFGLLRGAEIPHGLCRREITEYRQHLRDRDDLRLAGGAGDVSASGALLGHPRGDRDAGRDDRGRGPADCRVSLAAHRLCRLPDLHRGQDALRQGGALRSCGERPGAAAASLAADLRAVSWPAVSGTAVG